MDNQFSSQGRFPQISNYRATEAIEKSDSHYRYKALTETGNREVLITLATSPLYSTALKEIVSLSFQNTIEKYQNLSHPNLLPVIDSGLYNEQPYTVVPFPGKQTLRQWVGKSQDWREAFRMMLPVADFLAAIHSQGLLHRDLKPENIIIDPMLGLKVINYSLIDTSPDQKSSLTLTAVGEVTPVYTAPEVWQGLGSHLSDQYSFGVVLYELLTGSLPFAADNIISLLVLQSAKPAKSSSHYLPGLPGIVDAFINKMLATDPANRFKNMEEVRGVIQEMILSPKLQSGVNSSVRKVVQTPKEDDYEPTSINDFRDLHQDAEVKFAKDIKNEAKAAKARAKGGVGGCGAIMLLLLLILLVVTIVVFVGLTIDNPFIVGLADQLEAWILNNAFLQQFLPQPQ